MIMLNSSLSEVLRVHDGEFSPLKHELIPLRSGQELAQQTLRRASDQFSFSGPPIDLSLVSRVFGCVGIVTLDIENDAYLIQTGPTSVEIIVSARSRRTRRWRFSVAHELGHLAINRLAESADGQSRVKRAKPTEVERWCDSYATNLLMPQSDFNAFLSMNSRKRFTPVSVAGAALFDVSRLAFEMRYSELKSVVLAFLMTDHGIDQPFVSRIVPSWLDTDGTKEALTRFWISRQEDHLTVNDSEEEGSHFSINLMGELRRVKFVHTRE